MATVGEDVVEAIVWYVTDPHSPMPAHLAEMDEPERERSIAALRAMVDKHGNDGAIEIARGVAEYIGVEDS